MRRLALQQVRELRKAGLSYHEIGRRFDPQSAAGAASPPTRQQGGIPGDPYLVVSLFDKGDDRLFLPILNAVPMGLILLDCAERPLHVNARAIQLLNNPCDGQQIRQEIHSFAGALLHLIRQHPPTTNGADVQELMVRELRTATGMYRLHGSYIGPISQGREGIMLIAIETVLAETISTEAVRRWFGLTRKEAQVALLLVQRKSTSEIAEALHISPHTARHHVRRVLAKLGVHSRRAVASVLEAERRRPETEK